MFESERLSDDHVVNRFESGKEVLDRWLRQSALNQASRGFSSTFVWTDGSAHVVAYYSLSSHSVISNDLPNKVVKGEQRQVPAVLLAKFALRTDLQGEGLGSELLIDAEQRICWGANAGPGVKVVLVDAIDDQACAFYRKFGYVPMPGEDLRLYRKVSAIRADLENA